MTLFIVSVVLGLVILIWSADQFVEGASSVAHHFKISPLIIGMVIVGFGTSAPEMVVSLFSSLEGKPEIALGNAYGSNISNIALILGISSVVSPIVVHSRVLKKELPLLFFICLISMVLLIDLVLSRWDALILLSFFMILISWTIVQGLKKNVDALQLEMSAELQESHLSLKKSFLMLGGGLILLILSSKILVFGASGMAREWGFSDLMIGLTIVATGTSLPELASSVMAARKGRSDLALGNILGSNLFNSLVVVGITGMIHPVMLNHRVFERDIMTMTGLTLLLFFFGHGIKKDGRINRVEGGVLLVSYVIYLVYLFQEMSQS